MQFTPRRILCMYVHRLNYKRVMINFSLFHFISHYALTYSLAIARLRRHVCSIDGILL